MRHHILIDIVQMGSNRIRNTVVLVQSGAKASSLESIKRKFACLEVVKNAGTGTLGAVSPVLAGHIFILEAQNRTIRMKIIAFEAKAREIAEQTLQIQTRVLEYRNKAEFYETQARGVGENARPSVVKIHVSIGTQQRFLRFL